MEFSPLRFLDFDASKMLTDQVRFSQEEEARRFHKSLPHPTPSIIIKVFSYNIRRFWGDFWDNTLSVTPPSNSRSSPCQRRIQIYEQEVKSIFDHNGAILKLYA